MKNAMQIASVLVSSSLIVGCNSSDVPQNGATTVTVNNAAPIAGGVNCQLNPDGSGGFISSCDNGMNITGDSSAVNLFRGIPGATGAQGAAGTNGTNGAMGPTGPQGPAGTPALTLRLTDSAGVSVGTSIISIDPTSNYTTVWDSTDGVHAAYDMTNGWLLRSMMYYTGSNCTGAGPYAPAALVSNRVFGNNGQVYKVRLMAATSLTPASVRDASGTCTTVAGPFGKYKLADTYSNPSLPAAVANLPFEIMQ